MLLSCACRLTINGDDDDDDDVVVVIPRLLLADFW